MGLYEINLIVDPTDETSGRLQSFYRSFVTGTCYVRRVDPRELLKKLIELKISSQKTIYGKYRNQPIFSAKYHGTKKDAIIASQLLYYHISQYGMTIYRVKVKMEIENSSQLLYPNLSDKCRIASSDNTHYFEYKFDVKIENIVRWNQLAELCSKYGAHLYFDVYLKRNRLVSPSKAWFATVILRCYSMRQTISNLQLELLRTEIFHQGFTFYSCQYTYCLFDSAVFLDEGWLFNSYPSNIYRYVPVYA